MSIDINSLRRDIGYYGLSKQGIQELLDYLERIEERLKKLEKIITVENGKIS